MQIVQGIVTAGVAIFVALIGYFQWRTAQQKAVLDLFEKRLPIYSAVRDAIAQMTSSSAGFDQRKESEFLEAKERAYFFFGDDVVDYLKQLWDDITDVRTADMELEAAQGDERGRIAQKRRAAMNRIGQFHSAGKPLFAKYMRFAQTIPTTVV
jgi:hypothetical protein